LHRGGREGVKEVTMAKKKITKPGEWFIVRFRREKSLDQITGYMTCRNAYHAGHNGFKRKMRYVKGLGKRGPIRYVPRKWDLKGGQYRRLAYKFAELKDLRTSIRSKLVKDWLKKYEGILEIVKVTGCLDSYTISEEIVLDRKFNTENAMEIIALEFAMGE
jgi:hypothetical protein